MTGPLGLGKAPSITNPNAAQTFSVDADAFFQSLEVFEGNLAQYGNAVSLGFYSTSSTSLSMPSEGASASLTVESNKGFAIGFTIKVMASTDAWFLGTVTAYDSTTGALTLTATYVVGSGTYSAWSVALSAPLATFGVQGTSSTVISVPASGGSATLTVGGNMAWVAGQTVRVSRTSTPTTVWFVGTVTSYSRSTGALVIAVQYSEGAGSSGDWTVTLTAPITSMGASGTSTTNRMIPAVGTSITLTASTLRTWQVGDTLRVVASASPSVTRFVGTVTAYDALTGELTLLCQWSRGNSFSASWIIGPAVDSALQNMWTAIDSNADATLNLISANHFIRTVNGATTFAFSGAPSGQSFGFSLRVAHTSGTITWPSSVVWPEGYAPTLLTGKTHRFFFTTDNGGATFAGAALPNYSA